jgi:hypothetical protein
MEQTLHIPFLSDPHPPIFQVAAHPELYFVKAPHFEIFAVT